MAVISLNLVASGECWRSWGQEKRAEEKEESGSDYGDFLRGILQKLLSLFPPSKNLLGRNSWAPFFKELRAI